MTASILRSLVVLIVFLLPSPGTALSLPFQPKIPSDPCWEFAKRSRTNDEGSLAAADAVACPRYHPSVFDGRVCLGCCRDDYEIVNWDGLSFVEKAYALEDASDRAQQIAAAFESGNNGHHSLLREDSVPVEELKRQASVWRVLAAKTATTVPKTNESSSLPGACIDGIKEEPDVRDMHDSNPDTEFAAASNTNASTISIPSTITISTGVDIDTTASFQNEETIAELQIGNGESMTESRIARVPKQQQQQQQHTKQHQTPPPPTPCTRICRYNANCYDGKVCIGCFRDTHDIAQWSSMSRAEKVFSLEDAADRCHDLSARGSDITETCFEGGISEAALRAQATLWDAWN